MDYRFYRNEELEEMALEGDSDAAAELQRRYTDESDSESQEDYAEYEAIFSDQEQTDLFSADKEEFAFLGDDNKESEKSRLSNESLESSTSADDYMGNTEEFNYDDSELEVDNSWRSIINKPLDWQKNFPHDLAIDSIRSLPLLKLKKLADDGNAIAAYILGEKMLDNTSGNEKGTGLKLIMAAINTLNDMFAHGLVDKDLLLKVTASCADRLVSLYENAGGTRTPQPYDQIEIDNLYFDSYEVIGKCAYQLCSNLYELDDKNAAKLSICYEKGIGCERNYSKATEIMEKAALRGSFLDKVELFSRKAIKEKYITGESDLDTDYWNAWSLESTLWAQRALASNDADDYPKLVNRLRMWLAQNNQTDENGNRLDYQTCKDKYLAMKLMNPSDKELFFLYIFAETDEEKACFANQIVNDGFPEVSKFKELLSRRLESLRNQEIQEKEEKKAKIRKTIKEYKAVLIVIAILGVIIICGFLFPEQTSEAFNNAGDFIVNLIEVILVIGLCILCSGAA